MNRLYHGDCLVEMSRVADALVDLILCDLPYGTTACKWDSVIPFAPLWAHYKRIVKPRGAIVLTASQPFTSALVMSNPKWFKYCWVWAKSKHSDFINAKNKPMKSHEDIAVFSPGTTANKSERRMAYYPQSLAYKPERYYRPRPRKSSSVIGARPSHRAHTDGIIREWTGYPTSVLQFANPNNGSVHPTQKPVALMEYLIRTYTNEGETVMDNCFGSGTTGMACVNTNRNFIGIERDAEYFRVGSERISAAEREQAERLTFAA